MPMPALATSFFRYLISISLVCWLAACGGGEGNDSSPPGDGGDDPGFGLTQRVEVRGLSFPLDSPRVSGEIEISRAFPAVTFEQPVLLTHAPGESRVFVVEQGGRVLALPNNDNLGPEQVEIFLDIRSRVTAGGEEGLLGLAFDPDYPTNGRFYLYYSAADPRRSVLARYTRRADDPHLGDPNSEKILMEIAQPYANHNGGMIAFGPDNMLYIGLGDGGSGGDPLNNGQNLDTLLGSILRIDPRGGQPYAIPADNPFVNRADARGEIWAYGLRNPYRFSFDRGSGQLWAGDVGQNSREEINLIRRGGNYGWNVYEGNLPYNNPQNLPPGQFIAPVWDYPRNEGVSVTGGYVYRGSLAPSLNGAYVYGDFGSGKIWALRYEGGQVRSNELIGEIPLISSFGEDAEGELYLVSYNGGIYRLQETSPQADEFPGLLSETGLFRDTVNLIPAEGLVEYQVNTPLWSDDAHKRRWLALPGQTKIGFAVEDPWTFPVGTVLVKHFELAMTVGDPTTRRRLETRVLIREENGWAGYTYQWNPAQTEAELLETGLTETLAIQDLDAPGGQREQVYYYPSRGDCLRCHNQAAGGVLGVNTRQLNRDFAYPAMEDNQLRAWNHVNLFDRDIGDPARHPSMPAINDADAPISDRVRAYLDANCAICHRPGGASNALVDMRYGIPLAETGMVNADPVGLGQGRFLLVKPGSPQESIVWRRMQTLTAMRMPPVGSQVVDQEAVNLIAEWIQNGAGE